MNLFIKIKEFILKHKKISILAVIILLGAGFWIYKSFAGTGEEAKYVLAQASKQTIVSSISGTGQVSALNQVSLSPGSGASGKVVYLNAVSGQTVSAGTLLIQLDTTEAEKTIRSAESSLRSAQITLQKLQGDGSLAVPQNKQDAIDTLDQDYQSAYNTVSSVFTDLPAVMTDLQNIIYGNTFTNNQYNIDYYTSNAYTLNQSITSLKDSLVKSYKTASDEYTKNFNAYKETSRYSDNATIDSIVNETYNTTRDVAQAIKDTTNLIQFYKDALTKSNLKTNTTADTHLTTANSDLSKINSDMSSLLNIQSTINKDKQSIADSDLDIESQKLSLQNSQNSLQDAKEALSNYYIYAPFAGVVGDVSVKKGDTISSSTSAITFITQKQITEISLSETDIPKIKLGQKATLTFDAIEELSIVGQVTEMDAIGTVNQGVVSYNVQIAFDTQDNRVKPGMSVSASVITDTKQNVLTVPNSAVKTKNGSYYVLIPSGTATTQKTVEIGVADDTNTEIISGLAEGDQVVTRTISGTATTSTTSSTKTTNKATQTFMGAGGPPN